MKCIFGLQINVKVFCKLIISIWVFVAGHAQSTQNKEVCISLQYFQKNVSDEVDLCLQINTKVFYIFIFSLWVCVAMHAHITQNNKFAISLQYRKKNVKDEIGFSIAYKHQRFLQIDIILGVCGQPCPIYSK